MSSLEQKSPFYAPAFQRRKLAMDLYEGGERVEGVNSVDGSGKPSHSGACYLVRHAYEPDDQWQIRLVRAAYRNFAAPIVDLFASFINQGRPARALPDGLAGIETDADRLGTGANVFFDAVTRLAAAGGARFVLVDMEPPAGGTQAEDQAAGRRDVPYFVIVDADDVWDWQTDSRGLAWVSIHGLTMEERNPGEPVRFKETITIWTRREWIRHARSVTAEQAREQGGSYVEEARGDHPCGVVPLVPFLFEETSQMTGLSATDDVLSLILKLYRNDSEMDKMLFDRAVPEKIITGLDEDKIQEYKTASYNCLFHPRVDGVKACYVEPQGMSFEALARQIEKDEAAIREIALRMVRPQSAVGESAEAKQIDRKQLDTQLSMYARTCADAEARCWRLAAKWLHVDGEGIETPYQDKYDVDEAATVLTDRLLALVREGVISKATVLRSEAVKAVLPQDFDPKANARELREESEDSGPTGGMWSLEAALRGGKRRASGRGESAAGETA